MKTIEEAFIERCSPFNLTYCQVNGRWGIYWHHEDKFLLIDPVELTSSLFSEYHSAGLEYRTNEGDEYYFGVYIHRPRYRFYVEWEVEWDWYDDRELELEHEETSVSVHYFKLDEYIKKVKKAVGMLHRMKFMASDHNMAYELERDFWDHVELCVKQLSVKKIPLDGYNLTTDDVEIETFSFNPIPVNSKHHYDHCYVGFDNRGYQSEISGTRDYECIRHQLETFTFVGRTEIHMPCSCPFISLDKEYLEDTAWTKKPDDEYGTPMHPYLLVTISSNIGEVQPYLQGYCKIKQAVAALYEGLLRLALTHDLVQSRKKYGKCSRMALYNMLKSPIVEDYLANLEEEEKLTTPTPKYEPAVRQRTIRTILQIKPDNDTCIEYLSEDREPLSAIDDRFEELLNKEGKPIEIAGFSAWQKEMESVIGFGVVDNKEDEDDNEDINKEPDFDWTDFHKRGMALAKELREQLPDDVDLWYSAPFEDPSGIVSQPFLVSHY